MAFVSTDTATQAISALEELGEQINRELDVAEQTLPPGGSLPRVKVHITGIALYPRYFQDLEVCAKIELAIGDGLLVVWFTHNECFVVKPPIRSRRRGHEVHPSKIKAEPWSQGIRTAVDALTAIVHPVCSDGRVFGQFRNGIRLAATEFNSQYGG